MTGFEAVGVFENASDPPSVRSAKSIYDTCAKGVLRSVKVRFCASCPRYHQYLPICARLLKIGVLWGDLHLVLPGKISNERRFFLSHFPPLLTCNILAGNEAPSS
jgi:hypothetical protein